MKITEAALKSDFRNFLWLMWKVLRLPEPAPIQYDIARQLQESGERALIKAQRGAGKSYITAAFAAWNLYCNPDIKIMCVSLNQQRAHDFIRLVKQLIHNCELLHHLNPRPGQRDAGGQFDVGALTKPAKDPSAIAYGITSGITGAHVDLLIPDDVESMDNTITVDARERLWYKCMELENILNPGGKMVYLGTPHTEDSVYNKLKDQGWETYRWPAEFPDPKDPDACEDCTPWLLDQLADESVQPGDPTYPERFPVDVLAERLAQIGRAEYAKQYLLSTKLADEDRYPLKLRDFIVHPVHPEVAPTNIIWANAKAIDIPSVGIGKDKFYGPMMVDDNYVPYMGKMMFIDPSGRGRDLTGYAVSCMLNGIVYVPEVGGFPGGYDEQTLQKLADVIHRWNLKTVVIESNFGDGMFNQLLAPVVARVCGRPVGIEEQRSTGQKELRICDRLEPALGQHRVVISPSVAENRDLMMQVTRITRARGALGHDDLVEVLAGAVGHWVDSMAMDAAKKTTEYIQGLRKAELREWEQNFRMHGTSTAGMFGDTSKPKQPRRTGWKSTTRWG